VSIRETLDHEPRPGVRTFTPRWRTSALTAERMATLFPAVEVPPGPLVAEELFGRVAPLVVEIGSGHGAAAVAYAATHPHVDLITAEVHVPGVARMLAAAEVAGVANLRVWRGDALELLRSGVAPMSLAAVHLFFPDPWPKKKHGKRRFIQQHTLTLLHSRLAPDGVVRIATDHEVYAAHVRDQVAAHGGFEVRVVARPSWRPTDGFEAKGLAAGRRVVDLELRPLASPLDHQM